MSSQASSGYSTEGTQYNASNSFYLLDNVPGGGAVLPGPITVSGNLTVTGSAVVQGPLAAQSANVGGPLTAASVITSVVTGAASADMVVSSTRPVAVQSAASLQLQGAGASSLTAIGAPLTVQSGAALTLGSGKGTGALAGDVTIEAGSASTSGNVVISTGAGATPGEGNITLRPTTATGSVRLFNSSGAGFLVDATENLSITNSPCSVNNPLFLRGGLALFPSMGSMTAPVQATSIGGGGYTFAMQGNKAIVTTGGAALNLLVTFPLMLGPNGGQAQWFATFGQVGVTPTNVTSSNQNGAFVIFTNGALTTPITVWIHLL